MYSKSTFHRLILGFAVVAVALAVAIQTAVSSPAGKVTLRLTIVQQNPSDTIWSYLKSNNTVHKYGLRSGLDIDVQETIVASGVAGINAVVAGKQDVALTGPLPATSQMVHEAPTYLLNIIEGHIRLALLLPSDSPIHSLQDLIDRHATVGLSLGASPQQFLENVFLAEYGKSAEDEGVKLINLLAVQAVNIPKNVDAVVTFDPNVALMVDKKLGVILLDSYGYTGPAWKGGGGTRLSSLRRSYGYPEDFILHRAFLLVSRRYADTNPNVLLAFMLAQNEALRWIKTHEQQAAGVVAPKWGLSVDVALGQIKENLIGGIRDWNYITQGDVSSLIYASEFLHTVGSLPKALTWDSVKAYLKPTCAIAERAWTISGKYPPAGDFTRGNAPDKRGRPCWQMDQWQR